MQLEHYRKYLLDLKNYLDLDEGSRDYIQKVFEGRNPYLFLLNAKHGQPKPLTPKSTSEILGEYFPLVMNCNRHLLRTNLVERGVSGEVAQAIMGHGDMGQDPFARYSALSMADLEDAKAVINDIGFEIGLAPLAHSTVERSIKLEISTSRRKVVEAGAYATQRDNRARRRRKERGRQAEKGRRWTEEKLAEAENRIEELRDEEKANAWQKETIRQLNEAHTPEYAWKAARYALAKAIDELNERHRLNIPIVAPPRKLRPPSPMRNEAMFDASRVVQRASSAFLRSLSKPIDIRNVSKESWLALVLFSAACFGGLTDPKVLLAFGRRLQGKPRVRLAYVKSLDLCWDGFSL